MEFKALENKAAQLRRTVLEMCIQSGGHLASSFSCMEILVSLYYGEILNIDPANPDAESRDRFILSKGHAETVLYSILADRGFFPATWLKDSYRCGDCRLGGHPDHMIPGVEISSGALGHGLGIGAGLAMAAKADGVARKHLVLLGDAECTEGSVWETGLFAAQRRLNNLIGVIDYNGIGSLDYTSNYTGLGDLAAKWRAFGWEVSEVDGHDLGALGSVFTYAWGKRDERPLMIIATTVKGKGISFVENEPIWHVKGMCDPDEVACARSELRGDYDESVHN